MNGRESNFDYLQGEPKFEHICRVAMAAERVFREDYASCIVGCRRALECAVRWIYSVDSSLAQPWDDNLASLMGEPSFRKLISEALYKRIDIIRKLGNHAAHTHKNFTEEHALLCLEQLHILLSFMARCYSRVKPRGKFNAEWVKQREDGVQQAPAPAVDPKLEELMRQNEALQAELTALREQQRKEFEEPTPPEQSEYATRKLYIDAMLLDAGWELGKNWLEEVMVEGMPNKSGTGFADYVLYDDAGLALAVVEAKKTSLGVEAGFQQAQIYAELIGKAQGVRPLIFLTNGFDTRIVDHSYPIRHVASIPSQRDLKKHFNMRSMRRSLSHAQVDKQIAGRYYQEHAIKAVCEHFEQNKGRKALLVMATGSGKTRTVIALCKVLMEQGWAKNILFLADRTALVEQAKRAFVNMMPELSLTNLCEDKNNTAARCVFSTYNTMMNCIDSVQDENGKKLFTCGHFDLLICDEAHRSIYNRYKDIFTYFDAPLVGLTATPKNEIDRNTYEIFDLEEGIPTYAYDLSQAVADGYLVPYKPIETTLKFLSEGITYDQLSPEEKERYEETFADADDELPDTIDAAALNSWVFNKDTIRKVLDTLMQQGLRVDYGNRIGKSIIFARNHAHAEKVLEVFNQEYPHLHGQAMVIDNYCKFPQKAIDDFSDADKLPQIAITVDMLDTGIDVPEVLNLVFFKRVRSYAKFWQMIGRGTRLCPGLLDGEDKKEFYIFDFCGNFEFFRMTEGKGQEAAAAPSLQGALFCLKARIAAKLQDLTYQTDELKEFRNRLVTEMVDKVKELNTENFSVRQHLRAVTTYNTETGYQNIIPDDIHTMRTELAPLITPEADEINALRFDALMYGIERAELEGDAKGAKRRKNDLQKKVAAVAGVANIPDVCKQKELLEKILTTDYVEHATVHDFEHIRKSLRDLMKYLPRESKRYDTDFRDEVLNTVIGQPIGGLDPLENYRKKAETYIRTHLNAPAIDKLRNNVPLTEADVRELESIFWHELGTKTDFEKECPQSSLGEFVRSITGLDMNAAKTAFAEYLNTTTMDSAQIFVVNKIIEYIVKNGLLKERAVLQAAPFDNYGSLVEVFGHNIPALQGILQTIEQINANANPAA